MKYFTEFNFDGVVPCGSDSYFILDGRNSINTMRIDSEINMYQKRYVSKFNGFKIYKGDLNNNTCVYTSKKYLLPLEKNII